MMRAAVLSSLAEGAGEMFSLLASEMDAPATQRIAAAMQPHLFVDERPPVVRVAALGDLGGAIGASLIARGTRARGSRRAAA